MQNSIFHHLELIVKLLELQEQNPFKIKAFKGAINRLEQMDVELSALSYEDILRIEGIGKTIANTLIEYRETGTSTLADQYLHTTPQGILEMAFGIRGLSTKKIILLWKVLNITDVYALIAACQKDQLLSVKGLGKVTQKKLLERSLFFLRCQGHKHYAAVLPFALAFQQGLRMAFPLEKISFTGDLRRQMEVIKSMDFVVTIPKEGVLSYCHKIGCQDMVDHLHYITLTTPNLLKCQVFLSEKSCFGQVLFQTTGSLTFLQQWQKNTLQCPPCAEESFIFISQHQPYLPPYQREYVIAHQWMHSLLPKATGKVIQDSDIRGIIHCHSRWSDGENTLESLVQVCKAMGKTYLVITDHSQHSTIANGLSEKAVIAQHQEIDALNEKYFPFKIFKGIECDILKDGSLDYNDTFLSCFDIVIASVHQHFQMTKDIATERILKAIRHPYTTIIGHPTGRLLLNREGYVIDHKRIIDACKQYHTLIELNANPYRLDMDWRYIPYAIDQGVMLSINPDAHTLKGLRDTRWGIMVAQKAGVSPEHNFSSYSLAQMQHWLDDRKRFLKGIV